MAWFYLSFASADRFLGACIVEAASAKEAPRVAKAHGINPGGEVLVIPSPDGKPGPHPIYQLLSLAELGEGSKSMTQIRADGLQPPKGALLVTDPKEVN